MAEAIIFSFHFEDVAFEVLTAERAFLFLFKPFANAILMKNVSNLCSTIKYFHLLTIFEFLETDATMVLIFAIWEMLNVYFVKFFESVVLHFVGDVMVDVRWQNLVSTLSQRLKFNYSSG